MCTKRREEIVRLIREAIYGKPVEPQARPKLILVRGQKSHIRTKQATPG